MKYSLNVAHVTAITDHDGDYVLYLSGGIAITLSHCAESREIVENIIKLVGFGPHIMTLPRDCDARISVIR